MFDYTEHLGAVRLAGIQYVIGRPLVWRVGAETGLMYVVPAGFVFDVSVPKALRWVFDPNDPAYFKAAALHDHMLQSGWNRLTAAAEMHAALKADGVSTWRRLAMFLATALYHFR